jgi:hypothetical protein
LIVDDGFESLDGPDGGPAGAKIGCGVVEIDGRRLSCLTDMPTLILCGSRDTLTPPELSARTA